MHHSFPIVFVTIQLRYWQVTCHFFYWLLKRQLLRSDHYFQKIPAMLKLLEKKRSRAMAKNKYQASAFYYPGSIFDVINNYWMRFL